MSRTLTADMLVALESNILQPALLVSIEFSDTETAYLWTGLGTLTALGGAWLGMGSLMTIGIVEEGSAVEAKGIAITLSGLDTLMLGECLSNYHLGRPIQIFFALFSGGVLVDDPFPIWIGRSDQPTVDIGPDTSTITIAAESKLIMMNVPVSYYYTNEQQQADYPGDLGLSFVNSLQEQTLYFGKYAASNANI